MKLKYTARDFDSYFEELKTIVITKFKTWTKFSASNIGVLILELFSTLGDQNSFYLNRIVNQLFLLSADQRQFIIKKLRAMYYKLKGRKPASVDVVFSIKNATPHIRDIEILEGTIIKTSDGNMEFETIAPCTIYTGELTANITVKHWKSEKEYLSFSANENQKITLKNENYIEKTMTLVIEGEIWEEVEDDLLDYGPADKVFYVEQNNDLKAILNFGNGINGAKPTGTGYVLYKTGGGDAGNNIEPNTLVKIDSEITDIAGFPVELEVTNPNSPSGGEDEESIENAKKLAPKSNRSTHTIIREDYEIAAENVTGVARALAIGKSIDQSVAVNTTHIFIIPLGGGLPSTQLKSDVQAYFKNKSGRPAVHTTNVLLFDPSYKNIIIAGTIYKNNKFTTDAVKPAVDSQLIKYFSFDNLDEEYNYTNNFGFYKPTLFLDDIITVIKNTKINGIKCIKNVSLETPTTDTPIATKEYPILVSLEGLVVE